VHVRTNKRKGGRENVLHGRAGEAGGGIGEREQTVSRRRRVPLATTEQKAAAAAYDDESFAR